MTSTRQAMIRVAVAVLAILVIGTGGYMVLDHASLFDAFYMTTITVTTVGFSEVFPLSPAGRAFTIILAMAGMGVILLAVSELARAVLEGDLRKLFGIRRDQGMIEKLSEHIVVCGYGRSGREVVRALTARGVPVVVVELDPEATLEMADRQTPLVQGDATQEECLRRAGVQRARTLIACLNDDAHNVYTILLARQLNPNIRLMARAVGSNAEERLRLAGAHTVINPYALGGQRLALTATQPAVIDFIEASLGARGLEIDFAQISITADSTLAGKTLAGAEVRTRFGIIVVGLMRAETTLFNPAPTTRIEAGDVLIALGPRDDITRCQQAVT